jgi:hypothetical protein
VPDQIAPDAYRRIRQLDSELAAAELAGDSAAADRAHHERQALIAELRGVQIAARHADPHTTMRYDRARQNLDRHPNYILAAYVASGT